MPSKWHSIVAIIAVSAFCRTAHAQAKEKDPYEPSLTDLQACMDACFTKVKPGTSRSDMLKACEELSECKFVGLKAPPPKTPSECTDLPTNPPRPPQRGETCANGIMVEIVDQVDSDCKITKSHMECKTLGDVLKLVADVNARLDALSKSADKTGEELDKLKAQIETLLKTDVPELVKKLLTVELSKIEQWQQAIERRLASHDRSLDTQSSRLDEHERRVTIVERRVASILGIQASAVGNVHVLRPYDQTILAVGGELELLPSFADRWRALLAVGVGYAGKNDDGQKLTATWLRLGVQPQLTDWFHLPFGVLGERRFNEWDTAQFLSYGGFVEPTFCPGLNGHRFCGGVRAALVATTFDGPTHQEIFTRPDGSFSLTLGYAFLP